MIKRKTSKKKVVFSTIFQQTNNQHKTISHTTTMIIKRRIKSMTKSENRKDITKFLLTAQRIRIIKIYNQTNKIGNIFLFVVKTIFIVFVVSNSFASQIFHRLVKLLFVLKHIIENFNQNRVHHTGMYRKLLLSLQCSKIRNKY